MSPRFLRALIVIALAASLVGSAFGADDAADTIAYRLLDADGAAASETALRTAADVLARRFNAAGWAGVEIAVVAAPLRLTVKLPRDLAPRRNEALALAERPGTLELRIVASPDVTQQLHDEKNLPSYLAWIPAPHGGPDYLVQEPEKPWRVEVERMKKAGVDERSPEFVAARRRLDEALRDEVFTGDQLAVAEARSQPGGEYVVYFAFRADRKEAFEKFTERHVGDFVAIVVDGKVQSVPRIRSKLPGEGIIEGGRGPIGFTAEEAKQFAAVISSGAIPGRLVRVADDASHVLSFRFDWWPGDVSPRGDRELAAKKAAGEIVVQRCAHAGFVGVTSAVVADGTSVEFRVPSSLAGGDDAVRRLAARRGRIELRVRAETTLEDEWRERKLEGVTTPPNGYAWADDEHGGLAMLVETPEAPLLAKIDEFVSKGGAKDNAEEWRALKAEIEKTAAAYIFTNADVAETSVERSISTWGAATHLRVAVRFALKDERRAAFEKFTGDHLGRGLALVVDGKVHVCPIIKAAIPGEGKLIAPGTGYTDESAQEIAALLASPPLPCRLVPTETK